MALGAVLVMHFLFGVVWLVIWFLWAFFTSFAGAAVFVFLLAGVAWLAAAGVTVWRWRGGSRWYGLVPVGWVAVFLVATELGRPSEFYFPW